MQPKVRLTSTLHGMGHWGGWICLTSLLGGGRVVWHPSFLSFVYNSLCFAYNEVKKKKIVIRENMREKGSVLQWAIAYHKSFHPSSNKKEFESLSLQIYERLILQRQLKCYHFSSVDWYIQVIKVFCFTSFLASIPHNPTLFPPTFFFTSLSRWIKSWKFNATTSSTKLATSSTTSLSS